MSQRLAVRVEGRILADALCWACSQHRCSAEAPAARQFLYVTGLLLLTAFMQTWAMMGPTIYGTVLEVKNAEAGKNIREKIVPKMMGMCLGWALGNAFKARPAQNRQYLWG